MCLLLRRVVKQIYINFVSCLIWLWWNEQCRKRVCMFLLLHLIEQIDSEAALYRRFSVAYKWHRSEHCSGLIFPKSLQEQQVKICQCVRARLGARYWKYTPPTGATGETRVTPTIYTSILLTLSLLLVLEPPLNFYFQNKGNVRATHGTSYMNNCLASRKNNRSDKVRDLLSICMHCMLWSCQALTFNLCFDIVWNWRLYRWDVLENLHIFVN